MTIWSSTDTLQVERTYTCISLQQVLPKLELGVGEHKSCDRFAGAQFCISPCHVAVVLLFVAISRADPLHQVSLHNALMTLWGELPTIKETTEFPSTAGSMTH